MCTAISVVEGGHYFGRTLDYEHSFGESATVTPRKFPLRFTDGKMVQDHYALVGTAHIRSGFPLYYDAVNEKGLCAAGLNLTHSTLYAAPKNDGTDIAHYELILKLLSLCASVDEAVEMLINSNITDSRFDEDTPSAKLHWLISDKMRSITVEVIGGIVSIIENKIGVLTNEPQFLEQLTKLSDYMSLSASQPQNNAFRGIDPMPYSRGMGAIGLPGDLSSSSRFVRVAFFKSNIKLCEDNKTNIGRIFDVLGTVKQPYGCCEVADRVYEKTIYTSCCDAQQGIYYYTTENNHRITAVSINNCDINGYRLWHYPMNDNDDIFYLN